MMICGFYPATVRHEDQRAFMQAWLLKGLMNCAWHLLAVVPGENSVAVLQAADLNRPSRCFNKGIGRDAFTHPVAGHEAAGLVGCTEFEERRVLRVQLAAQRPGVREVREQLAALLPPFLLFQQCQQLGLGFALLANQLNREAAGCAH